MQINFGPGFITPEQMDEQRRQQEAKIQQMISNKMCVLCQNTFLINDQITYCNIKNECVDFSDGKNCENWKPLDGLQT